ncbi:MAG: hypothetical protein IJH20_02935 [Bacilli bacterium]|nr:hypothetical protein [Bacilli bacterium]
MKYTYDVNDNTEKYVFAPKRKRLTPYHNGRFLVDIEFSSLGKREKLFRLSRGEKPQCKPRTIKINKNKIYHYVNGELDILFEKLSDQILDFKYRKELECYKRYGKCHEMSMSLLGSLKEANILTGYISIENEDILHSVVECERDGKTKIIDYTKNIIMDKEDYVGLTNFRVFQRISRKDFLKDRKILRKYFNNLSSRFYLCFRDEIMNEIKNKKKILKLK